MTNMTIENNPTYHTSENDQSHQIDPVNGDHLANELPETPSLTTKTTNVVAPPVKRKRGRPPKVKAVQSDPNIVVNQNTSDSSCTSTNTNQGTNPDNDATINGSQNPNTTTDGATQVKCKRGRLPKVKTVESDSNLAVNQNPDKGSCSSTNANQGASLGNAAISKGTQNLNTTTDGVTPVKRKRGRPPKVKTDLNATNGDINQKTGNGSCSPTSLNQGGNLGNASITNGTQNLNTATDGFNPVKRKRGRPPKVKVQPTNEGVVNQSELKGKSTECSEPNQQDGSSTNAVKVSNSEGNLNSSVARTKTSKSNSNEGCAGDDSFSECSIAHQLRAQRQSFKNPAAPVYYEDYLVVEPEAMEMDEDSQDGYSVIDNGPDEVFSCEFNEVEPTLEQIMSGEVDCVEPTEQDLVNESNEEEPTLEQIMCSEVDCVDLTEQNLGSVFSEVEPTERVFNSEFNGVELTPDEVFYSDINDAEPTLEQILGSEFKDVKQIPNEIFSNEDNLVEPSSNENFGSEFDGVESTQDQVPESYSVIGTIPEQFFNDETIDAEPTPDEVFNSEFNGVELTPDEVSYSDINDAEPTPDEVLGSHPNDVDLTKEIAQILIFKVNSPKVDRFGNEIKYPYYPIIGIHRFGKCLVVILEKDCDPEKPHQVLPFFNIGDDGLIKIFFEKGTFTFALDIPQFQCFESVDQSNQFPSYVEGPFKRVVYEYPYGYYNNPIHSTQYRFKLRTSPEEYLQIQAPYRLLNRAQKLMCQTPKEVFSNISLQELKQNFLQLIDDFSKLTNEEKQKVFCGEYEIGRFIQRRLEGKVKSNLPILDQLNRYYAGGKFQYNHLTGKIDQVKPLTNTEQAKVDKEWNKQRPQVQVKDIPYVLPVEYSHVHPLVKKFSIVKPKRSQWGLFQGTWNPPEFDQKHPMAYIRFRKLQPYMGVDHSAESTELQQLKVYAPNDPNKPPRPKKPVPTNPEHPLGAMLKDRLKQYYNIGGELIKDVSPL